MKRLAIISALSAAISLLGCQGSMPTVSSVAPPATTPSGTTPTATTPPSTGPTPNIAQNWQFSAISSAPGSLPFSIAGAINMAIPTPSGTLHINKPGCFDPMISRSFTGTLTPGTTSLAVTGAITGSDGQVVTLTGSFSDYSYNVVINGYLYLTFTGTYEVDGGCADGDHGTVTGQYVYSIGPEYDPFQWTATFTDSATQQMFHATGTIVENSSADAAGNFGLSGSATFDDGCLNQGTINPGTNPTGSFMVGTSVGLEFDTGNGTLNFLGTMDQNTNQITGNYTVSGGSCKHSGSAVVQIPTGCPGCWDY